MEHGAVGGRLDAHRRQHALAAERAQHAQPGPRARRHLAPAPARAAAVQARHAGQHAALVQEHQALRRDPAHARLGVRRPRRARGGHVRAALLGRVQAPPLSRPAAPRSARPTVHGCTRTPVRSASRSRHSARVRWFASRSSPSSAASTSPAILGFGPPPIRLAARRPSRAPPPPSGRRSSGRPRTAAPPPRRRARLHRRQDPPAQVRRIRSSHRHLRPPCGHRVPTFSHFAIATGNRSLRRSAKRGSCGAAAVASYSSGRPRCERPDGELSPMGWTGR